jgi:hypothetical protein
MAPTSARLEPEEVHYLQIRRSSGSESSIALHPEAAFVREYILGFRHRCDDYERFGFLVIKDSIFLFQDA